MEENRATDGVEIDLLEIIAVLFGRFRLILGVGILVALAAFLVSNYLITPTYESTTKIYILNKNENTAVTYSDVQLGSQLTKDYRELIGSRYVLEEVIRSLGLALEYKEMQKKVSVSTQEDTRVISITVKDHDPATAMTIADSIREVAGRHIEEVMDIDAVNMVEAANFPMEKASPSCLRWTLFGGILGCLAVSVAVLARYLLDDTIKSSEDIEKYLELSTLALIPMRKNQGKGGRRKKKSKKRQTKKRKAQKHGRG